MFLHSYLLATAKAQKKIEKRKENITNTEFAEKI